MTVITDRDWNSQKWLDMATKEAQHIIPAADFWGPLCRLADGGEEITGSPLPWSKTFETVRLRPGELSIWGGINGHGKALSVDTPVPTPDGWRTMGDLAVGGLVFDEHGSPCRIVAATEVMRDRPCFRVTFSDGTSIIADAEHQWLTSTAQARQSARNARKNDRIGVRPVKRFGTDQSHKRTTASVVTTREIAASTLVAEGCWKGKVNHSVQVCGAIQLPDRILRIDPYVLGAWLGDGSSGGAGLTSADEFVVQQMVANGITVTKRASKYAYGLTGGLQTALRELGLLLNKHIPSNYLRGSYRQRLALLQGLMDTDGHVTNYGRCEFTSTNKSLADGVYELVTSLGIQAKCIVGRAMLYGKDCGPKYRVTFTPHICVFRLPRKAERCKKTVSDRIRQRFIVSCEPVQSVSVRCIQVDSPSRLFLASRAMIPTHNSALLGQVILWNLFDDPALIASMEMKPEQTMYRMACQSLGHKPTADDVMHWLPKLEGNLWIYDQLDSVKSDRILAMVHYAASELGAKAIVIDSLTKCGITRDDYAAQTRFVDKLQWAAKRYNVHVHLVCHMRKGDDENKSPGKFDIRGAAEISDLADNVFVVHRNKGKEEAQRLNEFGAPLNKQQTERLKEPDSWLTLAKNRHGGVEDCWGLWFHPASQQFMCKSSPHPMPWPRPQGNVSPSPYARNA